MTRESLKDVAIALSVANLCLLGTWQRLIFANAADRFLMRHHTSPDFLAVLLNVLLLSTFFWTLLTMGRRSTNKAVSAIFRWLPILSPLFPLIRFVGVTFDNSNRLMMRMGRVPVVLLAGVCGMFLVYAIFHWRSPLRILCRVCLFLAIPLCLLIPFHVARLLLLKR